MCRSASEIRIQTGDGYTRKRRSESGYYCIKDDVRYGFQCKSHSNDQVNTPVQEIYAGVRLYRVHVGVVITNQYFTTEAKEMAFCDLRHFMG